MMNTHPIIFSAPMVRAIWDGSKTQTRRVVKPQPENLEGEIVFPWATFYANGYVMTHDMDGVGGQNWDASDLPDESKYNEALKRTPYENPCPYGKPGDLLWVRETTEADEETCDSVILSRYITDKSPVLYSGSEDPEYDGSIAHWDYPRLTRPSIHMPRWASRLTLEITDVRVERVQDISEADAQAEGTETVPEHWDACYTDAFIRLWDSINDKRGYGWDVNPWVWALTFKAHQMNVDEFLRERAAA